MRQVMIVALTALVLTGCGAHGGLAGTNAPTSPSFSARTASSSFTQVLRHEQQVWEAANQAVDGFIAGEKPSLKMKPMNAVLPVHDAIVDELAARPLANGSRELVGMVTFNHHVPDSFLWGRANRAVRMVLDAQGRVSQFKLDGESLAVKVDKPTFEPVYAAEGRALMKDVAAFVRQPEQKELSTLPLWGAIAGTSTSNTFTVGPVRATRGKFGDFGRLFRFRGTLKHQGVVVIGEKDMELEVVTDKRGRVIGVN